MKGGVIISDISFFGHKYQYKSHVQIKQKNIFTYLPDTLCIRIDDRLYSSEHLFLSLIQFYYNVNWYMVKLWEEKF